MTGDAQAAAVAAVVHPEAFQPETVQPEAVQPEAVQPEAAPAEAEAPVKRGRRRAASRPAGPPVPVG